MRTFTDEQRLALVTKKALPRDHIKDVGIWIISTAEKQSFNEMIDEVAENSPYDSRHTVSEVKICDKTGKYLEVAFDHNKDITNDIQQHIVEKADSFLKIVFNVS